MLILISLIFGAIFTFSISALLTIGIGISYFHTWTIFLVSSSAIFYIRYHGIDEQNSKKSFLFIIVSLIFLFMTSIIGSKMMNADKYANSFTIADSNVSSFQTHNSEIRKVTKEMAFVLANSIIGQKYNGVQISSQYELNLEAASPQEVNGSIVWVIPLDYAGFAKWVSQNSIPGYIIVSATNPKTEAKIVLNKKIKASYNGYFGDDIKRKIWLASGMKSTYIHMEIDDKNNVFWIAPIIKPSIAMSFDTVESVLVMDAQTNKYTIQSIEDTKKICPWIDRIWPKEIIQERLEAYGSLQKGWINTIFGEININKPTEYEGSELWLIKAGGKIQWFSGMSSIRSDHSLVSAVLVEANGKNGKPILREMDFSGVTDEKGAIAAINSALGSFKWHAVLPQPVINNGSLYWHASIVSKNNIYQRAGVVQGNDIANVHFGAMLDDALVFFNYSKKDSDNNLTSPSSSRDDIVQEILKKIDELNVLKEKLTKTIKK